MTQSINYLIVGSGIAGLTVAIKLAEAFPHRKIAVVSKSKETDSNTRHAQGGIAVVLDKIKDSYEKHIADTLACGDGLCQPQIVEMVVSEGPKRLKELIDWGAQFDTDDNGHLALAKEGGHSAHRIVHKRDRTGFEIEQAILTKAHKLPNIILLEHHFATELIVVENQCDGAHILDERNNRMFAVAADFTILATGGIGQLYQHTTNSKIATGDGIAMAYRAHAKVRDMEFIQFHPTAFYDKDANPAFLISEALRGYGAYLKNKKGERFLFNYDERGELATRDIVSRSIALELQQSGDDCVFLDCTHLDGTELIHEFPTIHHYCRNHGIDIARDWIPVVPAQHYLCGGIAVDSFGKTTVDNLFAAGECARTGLHGANRLASNSLLEALVYAYRIYKYIALQPIQAKPPLPHDFKMAEKPFNESPIAEFKKQLQGLMQQHAGIIRDDRSLGSALIQIECLHQEAQLLISNMASQQAYEFYNMTTVALLVIKGSIKRKINRGGFLKTSHS